MGKGAKGAAPVGERVLGVGGDLRQFPEGAAVGLEGDEDRVVAKAALPPALSDWIPNLLLYTLALGLLVNASR